MGEGAAPLILIADDSSVSRDYMANILTTAGYRVVQAIDGGSAFKVVQEHEVALAIIDHYMSPHGGLEFARGIRLFEISLPMIMVTSEETSDLLLEITRQGISSYLKKPVEAERLLETVKRCLREKETPIEAGNSVDVLGRADTVKSVFTPEELMARAIDIASRNAASGHGGPFGAVVADEDGRILGEGAHGASGRADPSAHAEVMAIRQATEKRNSLSLENCVMYTTGEPTRIGKALIDSVGLKRVRYGLSADEIAVYFEARSFDKAEYEAFGTDAARALFEASVKPPR